MEYVENLIEIFNVMLTIHTCGEDTVKMGECLSTMRNNLIYLKNYFDKNDLKKEE